MINKNSLSVYKNKPALVKEITAEKIVIALSNGETVKVREKDIEIIHPGPVKNFEGITVSSDAPYSVFDSAVQEGWDILLADGESPVSLQELAELVFGEFSPASAWAAYQLLADGLYFTGTVNAIRARQKDQVKTDEKKRTEKQQANGERELFLERLRKHSLSPNDRRFMQDVEALACGKSNKSKTMKDIGLGETPEDAHAVLLESGFWTEHINPHPGRYGVFLLHAQQIPGPPPEENRGLLVRRDLTRLAAFAIDSPWSHDPDDAISLEIEDGKNILYVHTADPASAIVMNSPAEKEACGRGATLYIPEGNFRMLAEETLPLFALGFSETSIALTFKMTLNKNGEIEETDIFPSTIKVLRLTYKEADELMENTRDNAHILNDLYALAERNINRRSAAGAISINLPEVHIAWEQDHITIEPIVPYRSASIVRECMLLAGEGAGIWAMQHNLAFPYIEQEVAEIPGEILPDPAGSYQLRRCMRPRILSVKPGRHGGLGLDTYTQVTSPLRRYTDLFAHIQIRTLLRGEEPIPADEAGTRIAEGEAAALAVNQAERASRNHWLMVYLSGKKDTVWDAAALEKKGNRWAIIIPALALETQVPLHKDVTPNDPLKLILKSVNIPKGEAIFVAKE